MIATDPDVKAAQVAAAIGEPARAQMLYSLADGRARTSTELAVIADVSPSTASVHLQRLKEEGLVRVFAQGKHRYYSLEGREVAAVLEALSVVAGGVRPLRPSTPHDLRAGRTCYDHIAGRLGVALNERLQAMGWLAMASTASVDYTLSDAGVRALTALGIDVDAARAQRRRFAYACVDWSERRPHVAGALGAALLHLVLRRKWAVQDLDSRRLRVTATGRRELLARLGVDVSRS